MKTKKRKAPLDQTDAEVREWMRSSRADKLTSKTRRAGEITGLVAVWDPERRLTRFVRPEKLLRELSDQPDAK